jgi:hypothetical protein
MTLADPVQMIDHGTLLAQIEKWNPMPQDLVAAQMWDRDATQLHLDLSTEAGGLIRPEEVVTVDFRARLELRNSLKEQAGKSWSDMRAILNPSPVQGRSIPITTSPLARANAEASFRRCCGQYKFGIVLTTASAATCSWNGLAGVV